MRTYTTKHTVYNFNELSDEAIEKYSFYLTCVANSPIITEDNNNLIKAKTFKEWLATEV